MRFLSFLFALFMALPSSADSKLKTMIDAANSKCPMSIGNAVEVKSVTLENGYVVFLYGMNEDIISIDVLNNNSETLKLNLISALSQSSKEMFTEMNKENVGARFKFVGKTTKKACVMTISPEECRSIVKSIENGTTDTPVETLQKMIDSHNLQYPMSLGEGIVIYKEALEGDYVVHYYNIDESVFDIDVMEQNKELVKEQMKTTLTNGSDPTVVNFLKFCRKANKGVAYKLIGSNSGKSFQINIPISEL